MAKSTPSRGKAITNVVIGTRQETKNERVMEGWKIISNAIANAVNTCGLPVDVIAERCDLSRQYVYSMMRGTANPSMDKIEKVMAATGTSLATWLSDRALYGRHKQIHDRVQHILSSKGPYRVALQTLVEGTMLLLEVKNESEAPAQR